MPTKPVQFAAVLVLAAAFFASTPTAQLRVAPVGERPGDVSLELLLRKLANTGTFMQTTAHPDDEDNGLLAMLGRGQGVRTVLVTATRGNGGQNEIGPELFEPLGVLRTEELLAVHRFDGAEQYFTRAIDFGYSFSIEESIEKWGHDEILGDLVRHIRTVRPDVIAGFVCGGTGGGLHHQASARLTLEAFRAAADPARFPEQIEKDGLRPWQAKRVYCTDGFGPLNQPRTPDLYTEDISGFDPVVGRTYAELGLEARSMHKCQGTSQLLLLPGQNQSRTYRLRDSVVDANNTAPKGFFEGIDTTLRGLARFAGDKAPAPIVTALESVAKSVRDAQGALHTKGPSAAVAPLASGLLAVRQLRAKLLDPAVEDSARYEMDLRLALKERQFEDALVAADGLVLDALSDDGLVTPGQNVNVSLYLSTNGTEEPVLVQATLAGFDGAAIMACRGPLPQGKPQTCKASLKIPSDTHLSTPYWKPRTDSARYDFEEGVPFGVPFRPTPFRVKYEFTIGGQPVSVERDVQFRYDDVMAGEKRTELKVVPPFNVRVTPDITVIPAGQIAAREVRVLVANNAKGPAKAEVKLEVPQGWTAAPASAPVAFSREDEETAVRFTVTPAAGSKAGDSVVRASVTAANGVSSSLGYQVIEYPHIHRRHYLWDAATRVKVIDVSIAPGLRVGYIMGVGDQVPQAIQQLGAKLTLIDADMLAFGDLSQFDVIVTGVRAYERRADLRANNQRLLQYAENGGTVLVQYNKFEFNETQYGPFPAKVSSNRVTDENAPVDVLLPDAPVFTRPNRIGPDAWTNWVQERGLYFLGEKDPRYVDLVKSQDPFPNNAGPKTGALVEGKVGKGRWIYIGLGLWRQLPAGTPGAYRLMANLLSAGK